MKYSIIVFVWVLLYSCSSEESRIKESKKQSALEVTERLVKTINDLDDLGEELEHTKELLEDIDTLDFSNLSPPACDSRP